MTLLRIGFVRIAIGPSAVRIEQTPNTRVDSDRYLTL
ncbi:hypothetical protein J2Y55_004607 [Bosea sp. BE125]|nr:hypothetical protein [Bosea sp. BE125]